MNKTPRTDAELKFEAFFDGAGIVETVEVDFARQLETELAEARAEIARQAKILADKEEELDMFLLEQEALTEIIEKKDALIEQMREALENIRDYPGHIDYTTGEVHSMQEIAIAALAGERGE